MSVTKKRKANDTKAMVVSGRVGTRTEHFLIYISNVMDVLDRNDIKRHYLVMDNAPIHTPAKIRDLVENRGYKCLYLPPYSPFLNPIEEFWWKIKAGVRRNALTADDILSDRICEAVQTVTRAECKAWIHHAASFFPRCKRENINLWKVRNVYFRNGIYWTVCYWICDAQLILISMFAQKERLWLFSFANGLNGLNGRSTLSSTKVHQIKVENGFIHSQTMKKCIPPVRLLRGYIGAGIQIRLSESYQLHNFWKNAVHILCRKTFISISVASWRTQKYTTAHEFSVASISALRLVMSVMEVLREALSVLWHQLLLKRSCLAK